VLSQKIWGLSLLSSALYVFLHGELLLGCERKPQNIPSYLSILKPCLLLDLSLEPSKVRFIGEKFTP